MATLLGSSKDIVGTPRLLRAVPAVAGTDDAFAKRYRLGRIIGSGGVSVVLEAVDTHAHRVVAIKLLTAVGNVQTERFLREAKMASGLRSQHIVAVLDAGVDEGQHYIVMERLEGLDVGKLVTKGGPQSVRTAVDIVVQACEALSRAHRTGIIHRDIKASNLFVHETSEGPIVKVLDFGISKYGSRNSEQTLTANDGALLGSPPYMSPEQIRNAHRVDARTDIWSLGVVLYRLLTAQFPFYGDSTSAILGAILEGPVRPIAEHGVTTPPELEALIGKCLERRPEARFATVADLARALAPYASRRFQPVAERVGRSSSTIRLRTTANDSVASISARRRVQEPDTLTFGNKAGSSRHLESVARPSTSARAVAAPPATLPTGAFSAVSTTVTTTAVPRALGWLPSGTVGSRSRRATGGIAGVMFLAVLLAIAIKGISGRGPAAAKGSPGSDATITATAALVPAAVLSQPRPTCPEGMVLVDGGRFFMGSDDDLPDEKPAHHVTLGRYCIDKREVTASDYNACSARGDCKRAGTTNRWSGLTPKLAHALDHVCNATADGRGDHPINCVDWSMAERYCRAHGKRLPTEGEWEYAARGSDGRRYPWGDAQPTAQHLNACGPECALWLTRKGVPSEGTLYATADAWPTTAPVGSFPLGASALGVDDMVGNVWEWTADWYDAYDARDQVDPKGPPTGSTRVLRGGAWNGTHSDWVRPTFRFHDAPTNRSHGTGFRCAMTAGASHD